jgi:hypothetical protein
LQPIYKYEALSSSSTSSVGYEEAVKLNFAFGYPNGNGIHSQPSEDGANIPYYNSTQAWEGVLSNIEQL